MRWPAGGAGEDGGSGRAAGCFVPQGARCAPQRRPAGESPPLPPGWCGQPRLAGGGALWGTACPGAAGRVGSLLRGGQGSERKAPRERAGRRGEGEVRRTEGSVSFVK